jgi:dephospho-CoA kinase
MVGLTGGIGSGKSVVAGRLEELGAFVVDADRVAREIVAPGMPALAEIAAHFGSGMIAADGSLRRGELARVVFHDPAQLRVLNGITHVRIAQRTASLFAGARAAGATVLVHDMALIVESGLAGDYDVVVVVTAPVELRIARLAGRGIDREDALARMAVQASDAQRAAVADHTIDNGGDLGSTLAQVDRLWGALGGMST